MAQTGDGDVALVPRSTDQPPYAQVLAEAREQGYREGLEQGLREAATRSQQQAKDAERQLAEQMAKAREAAERRVTADATGFMSRLKQLLETLPREIDARIVAAEEDMLALCMDALARFLGEGMADPERMLQWLRMAARDMRLRPIVAVHLHPDDLETLRGAQSAMTTFECESGPSAVAAAETPHVHSARIQWVGDPTLGPGGCVLRSPEGGLDAGLETRLRLLSEAWLQTRSARRTDRGTA